MNFNKETAKDFKDAFAEFNKGRITYEEVAKLFRVLVTAVQQLRTDLTSKIDARLAEIKDGYTPVKGKDYADGYTPVKGKDYFDGKDGYTPKKGVDYRDGEPGRNADPLDEAAAISRIEQNLPQLGTAVRDGLELLEGDERLAASAISGLEEFFPKESGGKFIGPSRGMFLYLDGLKKGLISSMNLVGGAGVSLAYSKVNGQDTITINASGGGGSGVTVETPPEAPNAVLTVFTVSDEPKYVVADGTTYFAGAGYSYAASSITMDVPPSATIRAII